MATLADDVLADLDELDGDEASDEEPQEPTYEGDDADMDVTATADAVADELLEQNDSVKKVTKLLSSEELTTLLSSIDTRKDQVPQAGVGGMVEDNEDYQLVLKATKLTVAIDSEVAIVHKFLRDLYAKRFPELESLVQNPLDYAKVVRRIKNESDVSQIDLGDLVPQATVMVITVTATTTNGTPLDESTLTRVMEACDEAIGLEEAKIKLLRFVESRMSIIAPNVTEIVGAEVAARLIGAAGSLENLSKIPSCNVQVLGAKKKHLAGMSTTAIQPHTGFIFACQLIAETPKSLQKKAQDIIANKVTLAARIDSFKQDPDGKMGKSYVQWIQKTIEKWQEAPPARTVKALKAPDETTKKRRGGKRARKLKEKLAPSDMQKQANRMVFGEAEDTVFVGDEEYGLGMIGKSTGTGKVRNTVQEKKFKAPAPKRQKGMAAGATPRPMSGMATSGMASSLTFTPVQGLELVNPNADVERKAREGNESGYFSVIGGFRSVMK